MRATADEPAEKSCFRRGGNGRGGQKKVDSLLQFNYNLTRRCE